MPSQAVHDKLLPHKIHGKVKHTHHKKPDMIEIINEQPTLHPANEHAFTGGEYEHHDPESVSNHQIDKPGDHKPVIETNHHEMGRPGHTQAYSDYDKRYYGEPLFNHNDVDNKNQQNRAPLALESMPDAVFAAFASDDREEVNDEYNVDDLDQKTGEPVFNGTLLLHSLHFISQ